MRLIVYLLFCCILFLMSACKGNVIFAGEEEKPVILPVGLGDSNTLYNGIILPVQWPPIRSYSSEIRQGMNPYYLSSKPKVIQIAVGRQLFVDNFLIENTTLKRTFYYPEYYSGNPVLSPDKEWENIGTKGAAFAAPFSDGVWYDEQEKKFKMWYMAGGGVHAVAGAGVTCYAESEDGIRWVKPSLSIVLGTNIVDNNSERDASVVWLDKQDANLSRKYKMFLVVREDGKWRYHYKTSADGKIWRAAETSQPIADRSTVYKNPFRNVWVYSMRHNVRVNSVDKYTIRARDYNEHADAAIGTKKAEALLSSFWFGPWPGEQKHPIYKNEDGSPGIYNQEATPYESIMLGFFSIWHGPENDICAIDRVIKRNQVMVGYSRDGYSWYREDMNPFMPVAEAADGWNNGNVQSVAGSPLIVGDKLYFYVSGRRLQYKQEITSTGLAMLRRDGFASMKGTGELLTSVLRFEGEYFFVNARVVGSLKVELLDVDGKVLDGFSKENCNVFSGDKVKSRIEWNGKSNLSSLKGQNIKVRFYINNGEIFSFWISPSETGVSQGYTAGGGPNLNILGIDK